MRVLIRVEKITKQICGFIYQADSLQMEKNQCHCHSPKRRSSKERKREKSSKTYNIVRHHGVTSKDFFVLYDKNYVWLRHYTAFQHTVRIIMVLLSKYITT